MKDRIVSRMKNVILLWRMIAEVHKQATTKYPPHGWEEEFVDEKDNTPQCNLDAILRHTLKLCDGEDNEKESGLPHVYHLACRLQMYLTSIRRISKQSYNPQRKPNINTNELFQFITPETVRMFLTHPLRPIKRYINLDKYDMARTWLATYLSLLQDYENCRTNEDFNVFLKVLFQELIEFVLNYFSATDHSAQSKIEQVSKDKDVSVPSDLIDSISYLE